MASVISDCSGRVDHDGARHVLRIDKVLHDTFAGGRAADIAETDKQ